MNQQTWEHLLIWCCDRNPNLDQALALMHSVMEHGQRAQDLADAGFSWPQILTILDIAY